jgi:ATP synthase protein I
MSGSAGGGDLSPDERKAYEQRLSELGKRLDDAQAGRAKAPAPNDEVRRNQAMGYGMQMALDLVLGPVVGAGIGWVLDRVFGTRPILLLVFIGLGLAAGITNLVRTYRQIMAESGGDIGKDLPAGRDGDDD